MGAVSKCTLAISSNFQSIKVNDTKAIFSTKNNQRSVKCALVNLPQEPHKSFKGFEVNLDEIDENKVFDILDIIIKLEVEL